MELVQPKAFLPAGARGLAVQSPSGAELVVRSWRTLQGSTYRSEKNVEFPLAILDGEGQEEQRKAKQQRRTCDMH